MSESSKAIAALKKAANYSKLAMHKDGPRSFKRGQGALIKIIYKAGDGTLGKDEAKKMLGWRGCDVRSVARKAADNGYLTISNPKDGFEMTLTELGTEVIKKRLEAEDKAADAVTAGLSDAEKTQLIELCAKISQNAQDMGVDYGEITKRRGKKCGAKKHEHGHHHGHGGHGAKYVFVFGEGHHHHGPKHGHKHGKKDCC